MLLPEQLQGCRVGRAALLAARLSHPRSATDGKAQTHQLRTYRIVMQDVAKVHKCNTSNAQGCSR